MSDPECPVQDASAARPSSEPSSKDTRLVDSVERLIAVQMQTNQLIVQVLQQSHRILTTLAEMPLPGDDDEYTDRDMAGNPIGARIRKS